MRFRECLSTWNWKTYLSRLQVLTLTKHEKNLTKKRLFLQEISSLFTHTRHHLTTASQSAHLTSRWRWDTSPRPACGRVCLHLAAANHNTRFLTYVRLSPSRTRYLGLLTCLICGDRCIYGRGCDGAGAGGEFGITVWCVQRGISGRRWCVDEGCPGCASEGKRAGALLIPSLSLLPVWSGRSGLAVLVPRAL